MILIPYDLSNPLVLKRINTFVGSIADREYLMPESAIGQLRNFMMRIGVQFPKVELPKAGSKYLYLFLSGVDALVKMADTGT